MPQANQLLLTNARKIYAPYDAERYALKSTQVDVGDIVYVNETGAWWFVVDTDNLSSDTGYDLIASGSDTPSFTTVKVGNGTAAAPSITFASDTDTGLYRFGANGVGLASGGVAALRFGTLSGDGVVQGASATTGYVLFLAAGGTSLVASGTNQNVTLTPSGTGLVSIGGASNQGQHLITGSDSGAGSAALTINQGASNGLVLRVMGNGAVRALAGTAAAPTYTFDGDPDTGFYRALADVVGFTSGGTVGLLFGRDSNGGFVQSGNALGYIQLLNAGGVSLTAAGTNQSISIVPSGTGAVLHPLGAAATPSIAFTGDADTGFYRVSSDRIAIACGGFYSMQFSASGAITGTHSGNVVQLDSNGGITLTCAGTNQNIGLVPSGTGQVIVNVGAVGTPSVGFSGDADTGIYRVGADSLGIATGGAIGFSQSAQKTTVAANTATPAGGTAGAGVQFGTTSNLGVFFGSGVPTLSAAQGSVYIRSDGSSTSTRLYINTNGSTTWTNVTTAA